MSLLKTAKYAPASLGDVLIVGLGRSGKATLEYCLPLLGSRVESITVHAGGDNDSRAYAATHQQEQVIFQFDNEEFADTYDLGIVSPGISEFSVLYQNAKAACTEFIGEVEFAWRESAADSRWVAVTGTNGKTTTTALTAHLLQKGGFKAQAVGNIGDACIEAVSEGNVDVYVAEVSSYQLASTKRFAPDVAVLLNITPDHLAWHKSFEAYVTAKQKLFGNLTENSTVILNASMPLQEADWERVLDKTLRTLFIIKKIESGTPERSEEEEWCLVEHSLSASLLSQVKNSDNKAWVDTKTLTISLDDNRHEVGVVSELQIKGSHNIENALAAASVAVAFDVDDSVIREGLASFAPLEHRIEPCGVVAGVNFFNDSKATNTDAVIKALSAFDLSRLVLLLGGYDKGTDLAELAEAVRPCKAVVCFGAAGPRFYESLDVDSRYLAGSLEDAVVQARVFASAGDNVLLSPACASFDEFGSFEERGQAFKTLVAAAQREG